LSCLIGRNLFVGDSLPRHYLEETRFLKNGAFKLEGFILSHGKLNAQFIIYGILRNRSQESLGDELIEFPFTVTQVISASRFYRGDRRVITLIKALLWLGKALTSEKGSRIVPPVWVPGMLNQNLIEIEVC
jgi:hypothetical protein